MWKSCIVIFYNGLSRNWKKKRKYNRNNSLIKMMTIPPSLYHLYVNFKTYNEKKYFYLKAASITSWFMTSQWELWHHWVMTSSEGKILIFYVWDEEKQFHCVFPIKNKKNSLLALIFTQITPNLEEFVCTPWTICPPNLSSISVIVFEL